MKRKSARERDLIDYPIAIRRTVARGKRISQLRDFELKHGDIPDELLDAFASASYSVGWDAGVADANGYDNE